MSLADGEILDLGRQRLRAILTPMLHWPETMMTFEESERVLFTGDVFGSFGAGSNGSFAAAVDQVRLEADARRYYGNESGWTSLSGATATG